LQKRAQMHGFETMFLPVTHPGVEQKATWLQIRQNRPDYVLLWGWGVMNSTAIKDAVAVNYPREKMYGVWWSGAEQDVRPAEDGAKGYKARGRAVSRPGTAKNGMSRRIGSRPTIPLLRPWSRRPRQSTPPRRRSRPVAS
jgi:substrate-binding family protein